MLPFIQRNILRCRGELASDTGHYNVVVAGIQQNQSRAPLRTGCVREREREQNNVAGSVLGYHSGSVVDRVRGCVPGAELLGGKPLPGALLRRVARVRNEDYDPGSFACG